MIRYYCDHCGEEIIGQRNYVECIIKPTAGARIIHRGEVCDKCRDRLDRFFAPSEELEEEADNE